MATARARLVDLSVARWYHCITRCVRRAHLLLADDGATDRKAWIEKRLEELGKIFAIAVGGFAVLDNHLHILLRLGPELAAGWSDEEVVRRWAKLYPPRDAKRQPMPASEEWIAQRLEDAQWVARARERLQSMSWFMKCLKEPLARLANREDNAHGAFFEERFRSIAITDEASLLAACVYIDLNPVAAGTAPVPESSPHTSIKQRVDHVTSRGRTGDLVAAPEGTLAASASSPAVAESPLAASASSPAVAESPLVASASSPAAPEDSVAAPLVAGGLEESLWLCPIEDRRGLDSTREGMFAGLPLRNYLLLVDFTGRLYRDGKARISAEVAGILDRLGCPADLWAARLKKLRDGRLLGRIFASSRAKLQELAAKLGVRHLVNFGGCPA